MTIRRLERDYQPVGVIIAKEENPELKNPFCPRCLKNGDYNKLKHRIRLDHNMKILPAEPGDDQFLHCWQCGILVPLYDAQMKGVIKPVTEPLDNPNDFNAKRILGTEDLGGIKNRYRKLKKRQNKHPDTEVQRILDNTPGATVTNYQTTMPT